MRNLTMQPLTPAAFALLLALAAPATAGTIQSYQSQEIVPYRAQTLEPQQSQRATGDAAAAGAVEANQRTRRGAAGASVLFRRWNTAVPGAAYATPSGTPGYDTLHVSAGARSDALTIAPDGSYAWGELRGRWERTGQRDYPIVLRRAKDGHDWKVGAENTPNGPEITVWDGFTWYKGRPG